MRDRKSKLYASLYGILQVLDFTGVRQFSHSVAIIRVHLCFLSLRHVYSPTTRQVPSPLIAGGETFRGLLLSGTAITTL